MRLLLVAIAALGCKSPSQKLVEDFGPRFDALRAGLTKAIAKVPEQTSKDRKAAALKIRYDGNARLVRLDLLQKELLGKAIAPEPQHEFAGYVGSQAFVTNLALMNPAGPMYIGRGKLPEPLICKDGAAECLRQDLDRDLVPRYLVVVEIRSFKPFDVVGAALGYPLTGPEATIDAVVIDVRSFQLHGKCTVSARGSVEAYVTTNGGNKDAAIRSALLADLATRLNKELETCWAS